VVPQIQNKNPGNIMNVRGKSPIATQHGLMEKVIFEQKPKESKGLSHANIQRKLIPGTGSP